MTELLVIVPTRGRPAAALELAQAFKDTCTADTHLVFAIDEDDPHWGRYPAVLGNTNATIRSAPAPSTMVKTLNAVAVSHAHASNTYAIGFMGDDHRPRTAGWDRAYLDALHALGTGIVYGDDLLQHERIPTQAAMTSDIVRALGHMAPPTLTHLFVDNYWRDLGAAAECLRYLPGVVVEHLHPYAGKAVWDEGHRRVNAPAMYQHDSDAYADYAGSHLLADVVTVRRLRGIQ